MTATIVNSPIEGPLNWRAKDVGDPDQWTYRLSDAARQEVGAFCASQRGVPAVDLDVPLLPVLQQELKPAAAAMEKGPGFALIEHLPLPSGGAVSDFERIDQLFWSTICQMGTPEAQDLHGKRLHYVESNKKEANLVDNDTLRAYQTNLEIGFHGDGSDALAFFCHRQAPSGGESRLVSVAAAFNDVLSRDERLAQTLQQDFYFDARGQRSDGAKIQKLPIIKVQNGYLYAMYKRGYIELAQRFQEVPRLSQIQIEAMDAFDAALEDPNNFIQFRMQPGQILLANNYCVFHARTKFADSPDPDQARRFLRIWLTLFEGRPIIDLWGDTREFGHSYRRRMGASSDV